MVVSILGCGWYGKALAKSLLQNGTTVKGSVTSSEKLAQLASARIDPYLVQFCADTENYDAGFFHCDILVISIPPGTRKGGGYDYVYKLNRLIEVILKYELNRIVFISSTAVYGESNSNVTEYDEPKPDNEAGIILLAAEELFKKQSALKTTIIRFAGLVGPNRHPGRFFAGKKEIPNGQAPVNLIHLDDCIGITTAIIKQDKFGILLNAVSPDHPAKADFYNQATTNAGLTAPEFIDELKGWKLVSSALIPDILRYDFKVPYWQNCNFDA